MKRILFLVIAVGIIGGAIAFYLYHKPVESVLNKKPAYTLAADQLMAEFQNDETTANEAYLGKVIAVSGIIAEIVPGEELKMQVILETGDMLSRVSCVMEEDYEAFLARGLKKGDTVQIKGFCSGMAMDVVMDRCVIVETK
jgi:hypothetical protein